MSNSLQTLIAAAIFLTAMVGGTIASSYRHWWYRVDTGSAQSRSGLPQEVEIYRSFNGEVLFVVDEDSLIDEYIFYPSTGEIGIPNSGQLHVFSIVAYNNDFPVPTVSASDRVKVESDMNILVNADRIEFTTFHGKRVVAQRTWF
jgi:hypothetical protein